MILFHEVVQFLHALDVLQLQGVLGLPGVVDVRPVLPLHQVLRLARLFAGIKVGIGVPVRFDGINRSSSTRGCEERKRFAMVNLMISSTRGNEHRGSALQAFTQ